MNNFIIKIVEDRLYIKATQRLRRHLSPKEFRQFFIRNNYNLEALEKNLTKEIDKKIVEYLESLK